MESCFCGGTMVKHNGGTACAFMATRGRHRDGQRAATRASADDGPGVKCIKSACRGETKHVRDVDANREERECLECKSSFVDFTPAFRAATKGVGPLAALKIQADARRQVLGEIAKASTPPEKLRPNKNYLGHRA